MSKKKSTPATPKHVTVKAVPAKAETLAKPRPGLIVTERATEQGALIVMIQGNMVVVQLVDGDVWTQPMEEFDFPVAGGVLDRLADKIAASLGEVGGCVPGPAPTNADPYYVAKGVAHEAFAAFDAAAEKIRDAEKIATAAPHDWAYGGLKEIVEDVEAQFYDLLEGLGELSDGVQYKVNNPKPKQEPRTAAMCTELKLEGLYERSFDKGIGSIRPPRLMDFRMYLLAAVSALREARTQDEGQPGPYLDTIRTAKTLLAEIAERAGEDDGVWGVPAHVWKSNGMPGIIKAATSLMGEVISTRAASAAARRIAATAR